MMSKMSELDLITYNYLGSVSIMDKNSNYHFMKFSIFITLYKNYNKMSL